MAFIDHSQAWVRGELLEAAMLVIWGGSLLLLAALFWKFGHSSTVRTLIWPFLICGLIWTGAGVGSAFVNNKRLATYAIEHSDNPEAFFSKEMARVQRFIGLYPYLLMAWSALIGAGLVTFLLVGGPVGRAAGIGLILLGAGAPDDRPHL